MTRSKWEIRRELLMLLNKKSYTITNLYHKLATLTFKMVKNRVIELEKRGFVRIEKKEVCIKPPVGHRRKLLSANPIGYKKVRTFITITNLGQTLLEKLQDTFDYWENPSAGRA